MVKFHGNEKLQKIKKVLSNSKKKFYITTPAYYVNDVPHIGHAYTNIAADVIARFKRLQGFDVFFLTGTDEHGEKVEKAAIDVGKNPQDFVNEIVKRFIEVWKKLNISYGDFIRTTDKRHVDVVLKIFDKICKKGDIYKGEYEGWYCVPDETFWTEFQLVNGKCPECGREVKKIKEKSYFFKLSKYQDKLLEHIEKNPDFIQPESRKNEVINFIKQGLRDLCISRKIKWGIPVPIDKEYTFYVWIDALTNYISALSWPDGEKFKKYWPADVHLIGKEIVRFHAIIWPAILMAADIKLPKVVFGHGWWTVEGEKMSKSKGNVVDPLKTIEKYGLDSFRYFLLKEVPFGSDGDFSEKILIQRINSDLADDLGNLVNRTLVLVEKYLNGVVPEKSKDYLAEFALTIPNKVGNAMEKLQFHVALNEIWALIAEANKYVNDKKPWEIKDKQKLGEVLYNLLESLRFIAVLCYPFIPSTSEKIFEQLGLEKKFSSNDLKWGLLKSGRKINKGEILFKKVEVS